MKGQRLFHRNAKNRTELDEFLTWHSQKIIQYISKTIVAGKWHGELGVAKQI